MRTAIVTGGARRIGAAICRALAADGWHLLIHCRRSRAEAEALAAELRNAKVVVADLTAADAGTAVIAGLAGLPPARLLVNNAAMFDHDQATRFDAAGWDAHLAVNARAPALLAMEFARQAPKGSVIVNLSDAKLAAPNPDFFSYTVSKYALAGVTELLARALAERGIRVCAIAPAVTMVSGRQSRADFDRVHAMNALGVGVDVEEIIAALRFILAAPSLTGQTLSIDGGQRFLGLARDVQFLADPAEARA